MIVLNYVAFWLILAIIIGMIDAQIEHVELIINDKTPKHLLKVQVS